ncbi:toxin-antitoxin system YwqK family antitoxin [Foetidibacter luteolus]|uniref:toxin-antitoxin system YwqK family antitoxin n=1 Tax=Foetidibacter luteolus TaxID=2608880 RepID=UPI00129B74A6|nr:toxin-antitoxin system YwqK family antitoxin [Foetidibacter luteolus]
MLKPLTLPALLVLVSVFACPALAQERINSGELLDKGVALYEERKYKEAIALFSKISRSDTNYSRALHELSLASYSDSNFTASKAYAEEGIKRFPEQKDKWYNLLANTLDELGKKDEAIKYYEEIIKISPYNYLAWFNKGVTLMGEKKYTEAKACLQQTVLINPYYPSAHYFLGVINFDDGRMAPAMLNFTTALLINPEHKYAGRITRYLSSIANATDDVAKNTAKRKALSTDDFELQEEILASKAALDRGYKLQTSLEDPITRQLQVLLEKLEFNPADKGFTMQYYVPYFTALYQQGDLNKAANYMFSGLDIKDVQSFVKKNKKELQAFADKLVTYFNEIKETQLADAAARKTAKTRFYWSDNYVAGKGEWTIINDEKKFTGPWEFYHSNGALKSKGMLNNEEGNEGEWVFYYNSGQLKERSNFKADKADGKSTSWFGNGMLMSEDNYAAGELNGESRDYYYNGLLKRVTQYSNGKKTGTEKSYTLRGTLDYVYNYKDDVQEGEQLHYYVNGRLLSRTIYKDGKANGLFQKYENNGVLVMEGNFVDDQQDGAWKEYYSDKTLHKEYTYVNGKMQGEFREYHLNGKLSEKSTYENGQLTGKSEDYTEDGKLFTESTFQKDRFKEMKFYDYEGKVIGSNASRNGGGNITYYNQDGTKSSEFIFTKEGIRDGAFKGYYKNGQVKMSGIYKQGRLQGERTLYHSNGALSEKINFVQDEEDGWYESYHDNGKPRYLGWMSADKKEDNHIEYDYAGNKHAETYYSDNEQHGYTAYFYPNGKKDYEQLFTYGWLKHITQFDSTGKEVADIDMPQGKASFTFKHFNGKDYLKGSYENYALNGKYEAFFFDGSLNTLQFYKQGYRDSLFKSYYYGGQLEAEGRYADGNPDGLWKHYWPNGKLEYQENYIYGQQDGDYLVYNEDGTLDKKMLYKNNMLHGPYSIYGDNNQLAVQLNYEFDRLVSYTYQGKDGNMVAPIPVLYGTAMVTAYYKNGNKSAEMNFEDGVINGIRKIYFTNGQPYIDGTRAEGRESGIKKIYFTNGQLEKEENYLAGNNHGLQKYYHPNGKLKAEENWYLGKQNGLCKYYDETGKLKQTRLYYYNMLLEVK